MLSTETDNVDPGEFAKLFARPNGSVAHELPSPRVMAELPPPPNGLNGARARAGEFAEFFQGPPAGLVFHSDTPAPKELQPPLFREPDILPRQAITDRKPPATVPTKAAAQPVAPPRQIESEGPPPPVLKLDQPVAQLLAKTEEPVFVAPQRSPENVVVAPAPVVQEEVPAPPVPEPEVFVAPAPAKTEDPVLAAIPQPAPPVPPMAKPEDPVVAAAVVQQQSIVSPNIESEKPAESGNAEWLDPITHLPLSAVLPYVPTYVKAHDPIVERANDSEPGSDFKPVGWIASPLDSEDSIAAAVAKLQELEAPPNFESEELPVFIPQFLAERPVRPAGNKRELFLLEVVIIVLLLAMAIVTFLLVK